MEADRTSQRGVLRRVLMALLAAIALLAGGRAAQLAWHDPALRSASEQTPPPAVAPATTHSATAAEPAAALSHQELALLAMACPSSIETMPPHLRAAFAQLQTGSQPSGRSQNDPSYGDKVAPPYRELVAREAAEVAGEQWLVDPSQWYTPEDRPAAPLEAPAEPANEPASEASDEPATPPTDDTPAADPLPEAELAPEQTIETQPDAGAEPESTAPMRDVEEPAVPLALPEIVSPTPEASSDQQQPSTPEPLTIEMPVDVSIDGPVEAEAAPEVDGPEPPSPTLRPQPPELPATPQRPALPAASFDPPPLPIEPPVPPVVETLPPVAEPTVDPPTASAVELPSGPPAELIGPPSGMPAEPVAPPSPAPLFNGPTPTPPTQPTTTPPLPTAGPLGSLSPHGTRAKPLTAAEQKKADESHLELFAKNCYPSARDCAECHKKQYEEWSISSHAYAYVSPMFHKFEQTIVDISRGTVGYFCTRCHSPTSVAMNLPRDMPLWEMPEVAREGVTCIACHRINEQYGKSNGERRIVPGDIHAPVYGGIGGDGVAKAIADKGKYKVKTSPDEKGVGQAIHTEGRFFQHLSQAEFCTSCHQVAVHPGVKLEVVWEQYRASPACKKGVTCQHCHMGTVPGVPSVYEIGSIAEVGGKSVNTQRQHANHTFYGPGYSIAHPGIFPFHKDGNRWRIDEWIAFDWRAGWGTDDFEEALDAGQIHAHFPEVWQEADDRYDAREIIEDNIKRLGQKRELRKQVMEHGSKVAGPFFHEEPCRGRDLNFDYVVTNLNSGHNLPTASLGAQPQLWANVALIGPDGRRLWETGYLDSFGDLADIHSEDVRHGRLAFDSQLFNLQTMFLITGATGTDREFFLPVNISFDQLPQLRPGALPITVLNHPPFIRMESRSIPPLGSKRVKYRVAKELLQQAGRYRLTFRMRSRTEPIYFMRFCNSTVDMQRSMNEGILDVHPYSVEFWVK